ncbi:hypothetical protein D3C83_77300 [compost metagenome]
MDLAEVLAQRILVTQARDQHLGVAEDHGQHVVEVVGDPARELTDGFHLLRLPQLILEAPAVGEIE